MTAPLTEPFPPKFEESAAALLVDELGDVDDDDQARVAAMLDEHIRHVESIIAGEHVPDPPLQYAPEDALWILCDLRRREPTAGELRRMIRDGLARYAAHMEAAS